MGAPGAMPILWDNDPMPSWIGPLACYVAGPLELVPDGVDWVTYDRTGPLPVPVVNSPRRALYQVRVVGRSQTPRDGQAASWLEIARQALRLPAQRAALQAANLGLVRAGSVLRADRMFDDRAESVATMEVWFNVVFVGNLPTSGASPGVIETVGLSSELEETAVNVSDLVVGPA